MDEAHAPVGAAGGTVARAVRLGDEDNRALEQPDADQDHHHLCCIRRRVVGEGLGAVMTQHRGIDGDHDEEAGARENHRAGEPERARQVALERHGRAHRPLGRDSDSLRHGAGP